MLPPAVRVIVAACVAAALQASAAPKRIFVVAMQGERLADGTPTDAALRDELATLGWNAARVTIEHHDVANGMSGLEAVAAEAAAAHPDVIVASGTMQALAVSRATRTVPIVSAVADPVAYKLSGPDLKPLMNVTGNAVPEDIWANKVRLLKRLVPDIQHVYLIADPNYDPGWPIESTTAAARTLGLECTTILARSGADVKDFFPGVAGERINGVIVMNSPALFRALGDRLAAFAMDHRLAVVAPYVQYVRAGALLSYDEDPEFRVRRLASYVDRILRGAHPADLPFERAGRPAIAINATTAKKLGVRIPQDVLATATVMQ